MSRADGVRRLLYIVSSEAAHQNVRDEVHLCIYNIVSSMEDEMENMQKTHAKQVDDLAFQVSVFGRRVMRLEEGRGFPTPFTPGGCEQSNDDFAVRPAISAMTMDGESSVGKIAELYRGELYVNTGRWFPLELCERVIQEIVARKENLTGGDAKYILGG